MQQLQQSILGNNILPGKNPIFIVAPTIAEGAHFAMLLSNNLSQQDMIEFTVHTAVADHNYFMNSEVKRALQTIAEKEFNNKDEARATLSLLLDIGMDNNKLWGLLCDYETFFKLQLDTLISESFCAFVYNNNIDQNPYANNVLKFVEQNPSSSFLLHAHHISFLPTLIIGALPFNSAVSIRKNSINNLKKGNTNTGANFSILNERGAIRKLEQPTGDSLLTYFNTNNLLIKNRTWFLGSEFSIIIYNIDNLLNVDALINTLTQLYYSFLVFPELNIICKTESELRSLKTLIADNFPDHNISVQGSTETPIHLINNLISGTSAKTIIIDNLVYSTPIVSMLSPFTTDEPPTIAYKTTFSENAEKIHVIDILTNGIAVDNLVFGRSLFEQVGSFDESLNPHMILWDLSIRALNKTKQFAIEVQCVVNEVKKDLVSVTPKAPAIHSEGFDSVIKKHKDLFSEYLIDVLLFTSQHQQIPLQEIHSLNLKVVNLNSLLTHAKEEVQSISELSISMQQRIYQLESKWYYKLGQKLKHFKGIFFKKSTTGTGSFKKILKFILFTFSRPGFKIIRKIIKNALKRLYLIAEDRPVNIIYLDTTFGNVTQRTYNDWIREKTSPEVLQTDYNAAIGTIKIKPKISIIVPVYNPPINYLKDAIESVIAQSYDNWELCIADDLSPNPQIQRLLNTYALKDSRIKVVLRQENGHISACSNSALQLATGDFVLLLDHDDLLTSNCLFEVVKHINAHPNDELIYSDEDKLAANGQYIEAFFKPDWSPDKLMATNYISHVVTIARSLINEVGGFRLGFEGSQDYDLMLRCTERAKGIGHIPKILYHWRIHSMSVAGSTDVKPYAYIAGKKALEAALVRRNLPGEVQYTTERGRYRIKYKIRNFDKVSIIIPTYNATGMMKNTIDSILALTDYPNYEIIVLNNNSTAKDFFELMKDYSKKHGDIFRCVDANFPFNFSKLMNLGASLSTGKFLLMLNNDVEILKKDWITWLVAYSQNEKTGAVGVKLLYPDDTLQHAGTVIGLGDDNIAAHAFVGLHKDDPGYFNRSQFTSNYAAVTAACLMVRKDIFQEVGGMDETLAVEYNDVDFCLRILDKGYFNVYLPDVVLYHYESATRGHPHQDKKSYERHLREIKHFRETWKKYIRRDPYYNPNFSLEKGFVIDLNS